MAEDEKCKTKLQCIIAPIYIAVDCGLFGIMGYNLVTAPRAWNVQLDLRVKPRTKRNHLDDNFILSRKTIKRHQPIAGGALLLGVVYHFN